MVKIREKFHKTAFLTTRILSLLFSLAWLGLAMFAGKQVYQDYQRYGLYPVSLSRGIQTEIAFFVIFIGLPCLIHMILSIFIQQRKKWAVAGMFVLTAMELGVAISIFIVDYMAQGMSATVIGRDVLFPLFILILLCMAFIYVLAESYIAINLEKVSQKGFEIASPINAIPVTPDSAGQPHGNKE